MSDFHERITALRNAGFPMAQGDGAHEMDMHDITEGMEWMDELADTVADSLIEYGAEDKRSVKKWLAKNGPELALAYEGKDPRHIRWAVSDGIDRAVIRRHKLNLLDDFFTNF